MFNTEQGPSARLDTIDQVFHAQMMVRSRRPPRGIIDGEWRLHLLPSLVWTKNLYGRTDVDGVECNGATQAMQFDLGCASARGNAVGCERSEPALSKV